PGAIAPLEEQFAVIEEVTPQGVAIIRNVRIAGDEAFLLVQHLSQGGLRASRIGGDSEKVELELHDRQVLPVIRNLGILGRQRFEQVGSLAELFGRELGLLAVPFQASQIIENRRQLTPILKNSGKFGEESIELVSSPDQKCLGDLARLSRIGHGFSVRRAVPGQWKPGRAGPSKTSPDEAGCSKFPLQVCSATRCPFQTAVHERLLEWSKKQ